MQEFLLFEIKPVIFGFHRQIPGIFLYVEFLVFVSILHLTLLC